MLGSRAGSGASAPQGVGQVCAPGVSLSDTAVGEVAWNWGGKCRGGLGRQRGGELVWEGRHGSLNRDRWPRDEMVVRREFA